MVLFEPSITVLANGVALLEPPTVSWRPEGTLSKLSTTVRGSPQHLRVGQAACVGRGQAQLEVGGVLVVFRDLTGAGNQSTGAKDQSYLVPSGLRGLANLQLTRATALAVRSYHSTRTSCSAAVITRVAVKVRVLCLRQ
jgi:hypothetical protein